MERARRPTHLLNLTVPGAMGGQECMEKLRAVDPQAKVIISGGYAMDPVMADYAGIHFAGIVAKPYGCKISARPSRGQCPEIPLRLA